MGQPQTSGFRAELYQLESGSVLLEPGCESVSACRRFRGYYGMLPSCKGLGVKGQRLERTLT